MAALSWSSRPRAAVFDCDGLLLDTEPCWTVAETELFARRGLPFGAEQKAELIGRSVPAACAELASAFGEPGGAPALESELPGAGPHSRASSCPWSRRWSRRTPNRCRAPTTSPRPSPPGSRSRSRSTRPGPCSAPPCAAGGSRDGSR